VGASRQAFPLSVQKGRNETGRGEEQKWRKGATVPETVHLILNGWGLAVTAVSGYLLLVAALNLLYFLGMPKRPQRKNGPMVSVLIPARDQAATIAECLDGLLEQSYECYEVVVLDDESSDDTPRILRDYEKKDDRLRVIRGKQKPDGWHGKAFAVQQLAEAARGEYLYVADADTQHGPEALSWAVSQLEQRNLDAFSAMARQLTVTFAEKLLVPIVYLPLVFVPVQLFNAPRLRSVSFGVGQLFVFRKNSFFRFGAMEPVKGEITEDVALSRKLKRRGYRYQFFYSRGHVSCRMYGGFRESIEGFTKNIYDIVAAVPVLAACLAPLLLLLFVLPPLFLAANALAAAVLPAAAVNPVLLAGIAVFLVSWAIQLLYYRQSVWIVPLAPLLFAFLVALNYYALDRYRRGEKPVWKSRKVHAAGA
jgi:chlorobactene glucosyltransferase